jgi:hypothetical protein
MESNAMSNTERDVPVDQTLYVPRTIDAQHLNQVADHLKPMTRVQKFSFPVPEGYIVVGDQTQVESTRNNYPPHTVFDLRTGRPIN